MIQKCVLASNTAENQQTAFVITDTKLYVPVVTYQPKIMQNYCSSLKSGFKRTINGRNINQK